MFKRAIENLQEAAKNAASDVKGFRASRYLELLAKFGCDNPANFAQLATAIAKKADEENDSYRARPYWEVASAFYKMAENAADDKSARLAAAETYVKDSERRVQAPGGSFLLHLQYCVTVSRRYDGPGHRVNELTD